MGSFLQISPLVASPVLSATDVERALFQISTFQTTDQIGAAIDAIVQAVAPHREEIEMVTAKDGKVHKRELRFFEGLSHQNEAVAIRLGLAEIASRPGAVRILAESPDVTRMIGETAAGLGIDVSRVREQHREWMSGTQGIGAPQMGLVGQVNYWLSSLAVPKNWALWAATLGGLMGAGFESFPALAAAGAFLGGVLYGKAHRSAAQAGLIEAAAQDPLSYETVAGFFRSYSRVIPTTEPLAASGPTNAVEAVRRSAAVAGVPERNRLATAQVVTDFLNLGSVAVEGLKLENLLEKLMEDKSGTLYNRLAAAIGLGVLSRIHWQPTILNASVLDRVAEYKRQGKNVIFVANHRSHLDILLAVALLRDFSIRFVAKEELGKVPVLKDILKFAEHFLRENDSMMKMVRWGLDMFKKGRSPFFFIEGTRRDTRGRQEEIGMLTPHIGAVHLASLDPENTVIVPMVSYGFGRMLPKSESQAAREGTMLYQPTITSLLEPIEVWHHVTAGPPNKERRDQEERLNSLIWERMWMELSSIQAYMNHMAVEAAQLPKAA